VVSLRHWKRGDDEVAILRIDDGVAIEGVVTRACIVREHAYKSSRTRLMSKYHGARFLFRRGAFHQTSARDLHPDHHDRLKTLLAC
jgi:hypothetical protein